MAFPTRAFVCGLSSPVVGLHSVGRLTTRRFCRVCLGTGDFLRPQGAIPPGFYPPSGGLLHVTWGAPKRGIPTGLKVFLALPDASGLRPCDRTHLKTALCHIRALVGRIDKYQRSTQSLSVATRLHEARILRYCGCIHLTATSSGWFNLFFHYIHMH